MNGWIVLGSCVLLSGVPLVGQTMGDDVVKLRTRVRELEAENQQLKQAFAKKGIGSLGVPYGQVVVVEGEYDPTTPIKSRPPSCPMTPRDALETLVLPVFASGASDRKIENAVTARKP